MEIIYFEQETLDGYHPMWARKNQWLWNRKYLKNLNSILQNYFSLEDMCQHHQRVYHCFYQKCNEILNSLDMKGLEKLQELKLQQKYLHDQKILYHPIDPQTLADWEEAIDFHLYSVFQNLEELKTDYMLSVSKRRSPERFIGI